MSRIYSFVLYIFRSNECFLCPNRFLQHFCLLLFQTTLAHIIANSSKKNGTRFVTLSATDAKTNDVREVISQAQNEKRLFKRKTILFIDEIHRFNKSQQVLYYTSFWKKPSLAHLWNFPLCLSTIAYSVLLILVLHVLVGELGRNIKIKFHN